MTEQNVTRGEFMMLTSQVTENGRRLDMIDQSGTRGVGVIQQQITDLAKDVAGLTVRMDRHESEHEADKRERASARWKLAALAVAMVASVDGPVIAVLISRH